VRPLALALLAACTAASAQATKPKPAATPKPATPTQLPVTRVSLYKNGVGFFEHSGRVTNSQAVTIDFTTAQLNDVLQSLTAIDLQGGRITGAGYNSTTPLEQQLKALPLALGEDATSTGFYNAIRGARIEVHSGAASITGRLLSIELRTTSATDKEPETERRFLTVVSDTGSVRTLELTSTTEVRLLDTALHQDVTRYLELLASTRNAGLRHLTLQDNGTGVRDLRVSYISEVPVWKSTYRILFTDGPASTKQSATLQGWSVVDNTTGADWIDVQLSLIAGAPQSFIQPLSTPYYTRRPEVPLPSEAQLTPQTHESGDEAEKDKVATNEADERPQRRDTLSSFARPAPIVAGMAGGSAGGLLGGVGTGYGIGPGSSGNAGGGVLHTNSQSFGEAAQASIAPQTTTTAFDDFFEYKLSGPITIRKNESALVPILQTKIDAERVTLWSPASPVPLRALWITNTSSLTLDRGSFSIVEDGNFGGEGLLDPIHPNERRLLSYAADQAVRVSTANNGYDSRVQHLAIAKGVLTQTVSSVTRSDYVVRNAAPDARTVVLERPIRAGWTLDSANPASTEPKPAETTPTVYRFRVPVAAGQSVTVPVTERHTGLETFRLVDRSIEQITLTLQNAKASAAVLAQFQPVFDAHSAVVALDDQIRAREAEVASITADQNRLRENMKALKGTPEERALTARYTGELNTQEDRLATLHQQIGDLHTARIAADQKFQDLLAAVNIDETPN
jgi:hypothetical protein